MAEFNDTKRCERIAFFSALRFFIAHLINRLQKNRSAQKNAMRLHRFASLDTYLLFKFDICTL